MKIPPAAAAASATMPDQLPLPRRRGRTGTRRGSLTEQVWSAAKEAGLLLGWDELPAWRRDNAFLQSGYRPTSESVAQSLRSLAALHNETVNIWSHLVGAVAFLAAGLLLGLLLLPRPAAGATPADVLVFACFLAGAVLCLGMSAVYHALCNHSELVAVLGNRLDYGGILVLIISSYMAPLYYGFFCRPALMAVYVAMILILGLCCLLALSSDFFALPTLRIYRTILFVSLGLYGLVPVLHALALDGWQQVHARMRLGYLLLGGATYLFGALVYALRWPERAYPGVFDIWGSSHQMFHFFVLAAAGTHLVGMLQAFDFNHSAVGSVCA